MSVSIWYDSEFFPVTYDFPDERVLDYNKVFDYNKLRDGPCPHSDKQRAYIQTQRELYDQNLVRLYQGFEAKLERRASELGSMDKALAEAGQLVVQLSSDLYYDHIWQKRAREPMTHTYLQQIYCYWRDISAGLAQGKDYDYLWEYVAKDHFLWRNVAYEILPVMTDVPLPRLGRRPRRTGNSILEGLKENLQNGRFGIRHSPSSADEGFFRERGNGWET